MTGSFVLVTAARNEERFIGHTIATVCRQTRLPLRWVIVDDGSSDGTAMLVERARETHPFIVLERVARVGERNFGAKSRAIEAGYGLVAGLDFDFIGVVDADVGLHRADLFEKMLGAFAAAPHLGILGGTVLEPAGDQWKGRGGNRSDAVAGALQVFRRACFDACGGYVPLRFGGEDWLPQIEAPMRGWEVAVLPDQPLLHYRPASMADRRWRAVFRSGLMDGSFGSDPLFEVLKCLRRCFDEPRLLGALVRYAGFLWWHLCGQKPLIPGPAVAFLRRQQRAKVRRWFERASRAGTGRAIARDLPQPFDLKR